MAKVVVVLVVLEALQLLVEGLALEAVQAAMQMVAVTVQTVALTVAEAVVILEAMGLEGLAAEVQSVSFGLDPPDHSHPRVQGKYNA